jgi:hypothetical protein
MDSGTPLPCNVLGVDLSSRFLDLVLLDENANRASWTRLTLEGPTAFERARDVAGKMPQPGWYEAHGVYLIAVEMPESRFVKSLRALLPIFGAVTAALPTGLPVWSLAPADWKRPMGLGNAKPTPDNFPDFDVANWSQDSLDALAVAKFARDLNAKAISDALSAA